MAWLQPARRCGRVLASIARMALSLACAAAPAAGQEAAGPAGLRCFVPFLTLWRADELAAHPELADTPRYSLRLEVADSLKQVHGSLRLLYTNRTAEELPELPFFCYPNLTSGTLDVVSAAAAGVPVQPGWRADRSLLVVPLAPALLPGGRVEINIEFTLRVPEGRPEEPRLFALTDDFLSLGHAYPMVPAPGAWGERRPAGYGDFVVNDVAFFTAQVSLPAGVELAGPGVELDRREDEERTEVWLALGPARELYLAAGRGLEFFEERRGDTTVRSVAFRGREAGARKVLEAAHAALQIFTRRFGAYPFTSLTVVSAPIRALGMEFPGIVMLADRLYGSQEEPEISPELEGTLAHEVAHQWFYAGVGSDQFQEPWIDESLAQHAFWLYYRDRYGQGAKALREFEETWGRIDRQPIAIGMSVSAYSDEQYGAIMYGRAPLFLQALSNLMGEERFDAFLAELARRYQWRIVDGEGLLALAQEFCGCTRGELENLWARWVRPQAIEP
jgi:hypothetical protein